MRVLLSVLEDLWLFATHSVRGLFLYSETVQPTAVVPMIPSQSMYVAGSVRGSASVDPQRTLVLGSSYFVGESDVKVYMDPVIAFDNAIRTLTFGEMVEVHTYVGRWAHITSGGIDGWVLKDVLREQSREVQPAFTSGVTYDAFHSETQKLRRNINDAFQGDIVGCMLQDVEYVTYMLQKKGRVIPWGHTRPRIAGTWQRYLRGYAGIFMSISPKTDTVMEYITEEGVGHVAYVSSVFPDEGIFVSSIGILEEGVYSEMMLSKEEYRELRPVFIEIQ